MEQPPFVGDWVRKLKLGCGGFGIVTLWQNEKVPDNLAIKICRPDIANRITPKQRERWTKEVQIMKSISHPNIVHTKRIPPILFEALKEYNVSDLPILSMEYCCKGSLRQVLNQTENCSGLSESEVRFILQDISSAVLYLHNMKITHRDLKPDNIVLQILDPSISNQPQFVNRINKIVYKLIDLGYAKELDEKSISESFVGTLQYLAPEILLNKSYSCSVDYWSFGLVAFEIICGVRPFLPNMSPAQWLHQIQKKSRNTICIYQDMDENKSIVASDKIYAENFISNAFQTRLEKWFVLALDYDSKQRGYDKPKPSNNITERKCVTFNDIEMQRNKELLFFTSIQSALGTKILTVFVVYTYQILSYEIEEARLTVKDLLNKVQNDIKDEVVTSEMLLVLPSRENQDIDYDGLATQLWIDKFDMPMVHIWKKGHIISDKHVHLESSPNLIKKMCTNPKIKIPGHLMKKFASDCLYYVKKEIQIYDSLIASCNSNITVIQDKILVMTKTYYNMTCELHLLCKNNKITEDALKVDCRNIKLMQNLNENYCEKWTKSFDNLSLKINTINDAVEHITKRYESILRRNDNIEFQKLFKKARNIPEIESIFNDIKQYYEHIRRILKGDFNISDNPDICKNLKKAVIIFTSIREKNMLKDQDIKKNISYIQDFDAEITKIITTIRSAISNVTNLINEMNAINISRQQDIWNLIKGNEKNINETSISNKISNITAIYAIPKQCLKPKEKFSSTDENLLNNLTNSISGNFDCKSMIDDNISLRYMQQDLIHECLDMYKSIIDDEMDFDFLTSD